MNTILPLNQMTEEILKQVLENMPEDWLRLTTHRLDIYNEKLAKVEFLEKLQSLENKSKEALSKLPTAFDYIRLGHPLSCLLEWAIAQRSQINVESVISFSSQTMPLLSILRKNKFLKKNTRILYTQELPQNFASEVIKTIYAYNFELIKVDNLSEAPSFDGSTLTINAEKAKQFDFNLCLYPGQGSVIEVLTNDQEYIKEIQHVRRRESIAMTPANCLTVLEGLLKGNDLKERKAESPQKENSDKERLTKTIQEITSSSSQIALGSCGLSVQYAIMMGLIHHSHDSHRDKKIKFIVPPNCYGGTNDQARRVAACLDQVSIVDLPVDNGKDMVNELDRILTEVAHDGAIPYIIAEIPTNPRVQIPDLQKLRAILKTQRKTQDGHEAVLPLFILDQTFCPNVKFFGKHGYLRDVTAISYVSGSKFPSGGLCTAGYAVANEYATSYMDYIDNHLKLCDNGATELQIQTLTDQMPSMNRRIAAAYKNTRSFVDFIKETLPEAKINFVSHELAEATFTPSVFSLDLPTHGNTSQEREENKRQRNLLLIKMMIEAIPEESKHCVSYGQLKGCYWTIPATSTQGTTKESDKDYVVRVSVGADFNLEKHCEVFKDFANSL